MSRPGIETILAPGALRVFSQPVVDCGGDGSVHYYECLMRGPAGTNFETANILFEYARLKRREVDVDRACIAAAVAAHGGLDGGASIGLNVHASTLGRDHDFSRFLEQLLCDHNVLPEQVVVEIVEHAPPWDNKRFQRSLHDLRELGTRIALDDVGLGQSNYKMIFDVRPDYLKIDAYFVTGCHRDGHRRAVVESIHDLAERFGARAIAEGVETEDDLSMLRDMGLNLLQGYHLARPVPKTVEPRRSTALQTLPVPA